MTNEEAIRELKADYCGNRIICELYPDQCNREDCEIWWAITALENAKNDNLTPESAQNVPNQAFKMQKSDALWAKTGETCSDTISRQAAIDAVNNIMPTKEGFLEPSEVLCELMQLPPAQPEPCEDVVSREYLTEHIEACWMNGRMMKPDLNEVLSWIDDIPSAQPEITPDGTLHVSIDADIANVGRILLSQTGTQRGGLYYKDEQPEETCDTCKHGYFGDSQCENCRVRYPSHYERRTDD